MDKIFNCCRSILLGLLALTAFLCMLVGCFELYIEIFHPEDTAIARMEKRAIDAEGEAAKYQYKYNQILEDQQESNEEIRYLKYKIRSLESEIYLLTGK